MIELDPRFFDCECEYNYIRLVGTKCMVCGAVANDSPDSRKSEVDALLKFWAVRIKDLNNE